jgi:C_GCAxxG_C_C family probable redox protein
MDSNFFIFISSILISYPHFAPMCREYAFFVPGIEKRTKVCYDKEKIGGIFMDHSMHSAELFMQGYNCAQAIAVAFSDVTGLTPDFSAKMASSFGGGMGRMREVCGAVSGMLMVAGLLYGYDGPDEGENKMNHYARVQELAEGFRSQVGSIVCREILKNPPSDPNPSPRTEEYYRTRPCARMVMVAAQVLDRYIAEHPL